LVRLAAGIAEREIAEQEARRAGPFDDVLGGPHDHRRDAVSFEVSGDQTHGLVADGSSRHQQSGVVLVLPAARQDLRRIGLDRYALAAVGRRTVETPGEPEAALAGE